MDTFTCYDCHETKPMRTEGGTGYASLDKSNEHKICYECCAVRDKKHMDETGKICLYLTCEPAHYEKRPEGRKTLGKVSNWPGTLTFPCHTRTSRHNIAGVRYDVWFRDHNGNNWHGVCYGDNTQLTRCRRVT